ncbi:MAG: NADPH:quinone reductase, partial [Thermoleophilaceae bacterium]|nr:NADPH:quinone reductase [Thermoleophilaceae bacterium]
RAGINFADTHQTQNVYVRRFELPLIPGGEVAGVVEQAGGGFEAGERVVAMTGAGGYAEYVAADAATTFRIPDGLDDGVALALLIQGLTAWHLYRTCARVAPGETVVVISGAGGVGSLAVQLGKPMGAGRVIATASSQEKRELTLELGADAAVDPDDGDFTEKLIEANGGEPVDAVFEMAGGALFDGALNALAPLGRIVTYGIASREQNEVRTGKLMRKSWSVVGFWLFHCLERPDELIREPLADLYERAARGEVRAIVGGTWPLAEARDAHEALKSRRTRGKLLLDATA